MPFEPPSLAFFLPPLRHRALPRPRGSPPPLLLLRALFPFSAPSSQSVVRLPSSPAPPFTFPSGFFLSDGHPSEHPRQTHPRPPLSLPAPAPPPRPLLTRRRRTPSRSPLCPHRPLIASCPTPFPSPFSRPPQPCPVLSPQSPFAASPLPPQVSKFVRRSTTRPAGYRPSPQSTSLRDSRSAPPPAS